MYKRKSGGIGMYVRSTIAKHFEVIQNESEYILWISISKQFTDYDENIVLGIMYIPPENSRFLNEEHFTKLDNEIANKCYSNKYVYLVGDANCRVGSMRDFVMSDPHLNDTFNIDFDLQASLDKYKILENLSITLQRKSQDSKLNTNGYKLLDICKNNNLFILNGRLSADSDVGRFTFREKSVIDYVIASAECFEKISHFETIETDPIFSDGHNLLSWCISINDKHINHSLRKDTTRSTIWIPNSENDFVNNIDQNKLSDLCEQLNTYPQSQDTVDFISTELQSIFETAANKSFPHNHRIYPNIKNQHKNKPWFGPQCLRARRSYHLAKSNYNKTKDNQTKHTLNLASKQYKRTMDFFIKKHKNENSRKLREISSKNPKQYWKYLNNLNPRHKVNESPSPDEFLEYFKSLNENNVQDDRFSDLQNDVQNQNDCLNSEITEYEINKCIMNLKNSKAPSPFDNIINKYIKSTKQLLLPFYCKFFNCLLNTGLIPKSWLEGVIFPIFKSKGDPKDSSV